MGLLSDRLPEELKQAMRDKDKVRVSVLRMVKAAVKNSEIELQHPLSDDEVLAILRKEVKQRKDAMDIAMGSGRTDFIASLEDELRVLASYLPAQLSEDEILAAVKDVVAEVGAHSKADMGKVMPVILSRIGSSADGKTVSRIVSQVLS